MIARHRRRELFPPDRGLQARMLLAMAATPLSVVVAVVLVAWLLPERFLWALVGATVLGIGFLGWELHKRLRVGVMIEPPPEVHAIVDRLCVAADLPRPLVSLDPDRQPNSWVVDLPRRRPHLWLTRGLMGGFFGLASLAPLASALLKVSGALEQVPKADLREVAGFQTLNLLQGGSRARVVAVADAPERRAARRRAGADGAPAGRGASGSFARIGSGAWRRHWTAKGTSTS